MGKTIIVSSHILPELADLCTSIAIIEKGRLLYHGGVDEALQKTASLQAQRIVVAVTERAEEAEALLRTQEGVTGVTLRDGVLELEAGEDWTPARVFDVLTAAGFRLSRLDEARVNLEDAFLHLTKGQVA